ncbi:stage III sporulation protein AF [Fictibacillus aquaticus]|uniref:Stage III sporulation protein AF n=1 Tax=Fictibacillus aquaticus TaxID=2021314 RepID=A0A235F9F2_9BACL|nr:stage III sporulation protein AF [Fictibacillus aquaticus]OYD57799.1 stage III sporulation protein AF [Fictibacillus aquaticus]
MELLTGWVSNIILLILLAGIIEMLLPDSSFQKYIRLVIGLLLILAMLTPLLQIMKTDMNSVLAAMNLADEKKEEKIKNSIENKKTEIQASQAAYILEQMAVPLKNKVKEELKSSYGLTITSLRLQANPKKDGRPFSYEDITAARVVLGKADGQTAIEGVEEVNITVSGSAKDQGSDDGFLPQELASWLAGQWQMEKKQIILIEEGGE